MLIVASEICLRLLLHFMRAAASRTFCTAGKSRPIRMAMIAMTTSSSISVKPRVLKRNHLMRTPPNRTEMKSGQVTRRTRPTLRRGPGGAAGNGTFPYGRHPWYARAFPRVYEFNPRSTDRFRTGGIRERVLGVGSGFGLIH